MRIGVEVAKGFFQFSAVVFVAVVAAGSLRMAFRAPHSPGEPRKVRTQEIPPVLLAGLVEPLRVVSVPPVTIEGHPHTWRRTRGQGAHLARMFASEDARALRSEGNGTSGRLTEDHRMIAAVVWNNRGARSDFGGWIGVMRWLSPHVGGVKLPKRHRHEINATLPLDDSFPPPSWIDCNNVSRGSKCDGDWAVHGPNWVRLRENAIRLWTRSNPAWFQKTSGMRPKKWGNAQDIMRLLRLYGDRWCVLDIGEKNFFAARPGQGCELGDPATVAAREGRRP